MTICINGEDFDLSLDERLSLLDLLRDELQLTGTKKGCDQGACGVCTVLVDGQRVLSCLSLAVQCEGRDVVTIEGVARRPELSALQQAFVEHDGLQCGYCTPGQICSAAGMLAELGRGVPSQVTANLNRSAAATGDEIRERMSGNLCRCGAYNGIVEAIVQVHRREAP